MQGKSLLEINYFFTARC